MPKFNPAVETSAPSEKTPGKWLVQIDRTVTLPKAGVKPGVDVKRTKNNLHELWGIAMTVIDDHPAAPRGSVIFDNLTWDNDKGQSRIYALLKAMGYPVDDWKRITDPTKFPEITPEMLFGKPFVYSSDLDENGYLTANGFNPFLSKEAARGPKTTPSKGRGGANGAGAAGSNGGGAGHGANGGRAVAAGMCADCGHAAHRDKAEECTAPLTNGQPCSCPPF